MDSFVTFILAYLASCASFAVANCRNQLGACWTMTPQAKGIVSQGWYRVMRHPIYVLSSFQWFCLVAAAYPKLAWVPLAVLIPIQMLRARAEEKLLTATFPEAYTVYKKVVRWF